MSKPKILEQIGNGGGVFIATYNTTTYQEIQDAFDSGKDIVCYYNDKKIYDLCTVPTGSNTLYFYNREYSATNNNCANTNVKYFTLNTSDVWSQPQDSAKFKLNVPIYYSGNTNIGGTLGYYRPIHLSTAEPTSSYGYVGDVWIQYEE